MPMCSAWCSRGLLCSSPLFTAVSAFCVHLSGTKLQICNSPPCEQLCFSFRAWKSLSVQPGNARAALQVVAGADRISEIQLFFPLMVLSASPVVSGARCSAALMLHCSWGCGPQQWGSWCSDCHPQLLKSWHTESKQ